MPWELALSKWFMCIYSDVLPVETVLRIWDCLFYEGSKILIRVALTLVLQRQHQILMTDEFSKLVIEFKNCAADKTVVACHTFIPEVFRLSSPLPSKQVEKMRQGISMEVNKELSIQDEKRKEMKQRNEKENKAIAMDDSGEERDGNKKDLESPQEPKKEKMI